MANNSPHPSSFLLHPSLRRGFTLTELLIVIAIMVVVAAFLIPAVKPALQDRKIRESARMVNVFFASAQARAIEKQRPVGVWLERNPLNPNECIQLYMAEVPLPYSGDMLGAQADLQGIAGGYGTTGTAQFDASSASLPSLVQVGDLIKFNHKGPFYTILTVPAAGTPAPFQITFTHPSAPPPRDSGTVGVPYQIIRQPKRNSATTFALPSKTCINLYFSGGGFGGHGTPVSVGGGAMGATDLTPLLVCFSPSGRLDKVYARDPTDTAVDPLGRWKGIAATEALYFLVTRNDIDGITTEDFRYLEDPGSLWISLGHNTGSVTTVDNVNTTSGAFPSGTLAQNIAKVAEARRFAREKTSMGGR